MPRVIACVNNPKNAWMLTAEIGVDVALNQADIFARLIAEEMSLDDIMTLLTLRKGEFSIVEERANYPKPGGRDSGGGASIEAGRARGGAWEGRCSVVCNRIVGIEAP